MKEMLSFVCCIIFECVEIFFFFFYSSSFSLVDCRLPLSKRRVAIAFQADHIAASCNGTLLDSSPSFIRSFARRHRHQHIGREWHMESWKAAVQWPTDRPSTSLVHEHKRKNNHHHHHHFYISKTPPYFLQIPFFFFFLFLLQVTIKRISC